MNQTLTTAEKREALRLARNNLREVPFFRAHPTQSRFVDLALVEAAERVELPLIFRALSDDRFEIGRAGETRVVRTTLRGAFFAWLAVDDRGRTDTVRASDLAAPWATAPRNSARKAIRREVADWLAAEGFVELAAEVRTIEVVAGVIRYDPAAGAPRIETQ